MFLSSCSTIEAGSRSFARWQGNRQGLSSPTRTARFFKRFLSTPPSPRNAGYGRESLGSAGTDLFCSATDPAMPDMEGWWVDAATGKVTPIAGFSSSALSRVAGFSDGGFVIKGDLNTRQSLRASMVVSTRSTLGGK